MTLNFFGIVPYYCTFIFFCWGAARILRLNLLAAIGTIGAIFVICMVHPSNFKIHSENRHPLLTQIGIHTYTRTSDILIIERSALSSRQSPITREIIWVSTSIIGPCNRISSYCGLLSIHILTFVSGLRARQWPLSSQRCVSETPHCPQEQAPNHGHRVHL